MNRHVVAFAVVGGPVLSMMLMACGAKPAAEPTEKTPSAAVTSTASAESEEFHEEVSGGPKGASSVREYTLDITREETIDTKTGAKKTVPLRVAVRFPVPKITPTGVREPHVVNRVLWEARKDFAQCFYGSSSKPGPGRNIAGQASLVAFVDVGKDGTLSAVGIESKDKSLDDPGFLPCVVKRLETLKFDAAGDRTKVRFKLKLETKDATHIADFKAP